MFVFVCIHDYVRVCVYSGRFLRGEVEVGRVHTEGLSDTWFIGGSGNKRGGLTFSALTDLPTKRV